MVFTEVPLVGMPFVSNSTDDCRRCIVSIMVQNVVAINNSVSQDPNMKYHSSIVLYQVLQLFY